MRLVTSQGKTGRFFLPCRVVGENQSLSLSHPPGLDTPALSAAFLTTVHSLSFAHPACQDDPVDPTTRAILYLVPTVPPLNLLFILRKSTVASVLRQPAGLLCMVMGTPGDSHVRMHKGTNVLRVAFERPRETRAIGYSDMYYVTSSDKLTTVNARVRC